MVYKRDQTKTANLPACLKFQSLQSTVSPRFSFKIRILDLS